MFASGRGHGTAVGSTINWRWKEKMEVTAVFRIAAAVRSSVASF